MPATASVDPRGPRFAAAVTTVVLAAVLVTGWWPLLAAQAAVFAVGVVAGPSATPYALLYRLLVAPRLAPTDDREAVASLRFAQGVGLLFTVAGTVGYVGGPTALGLAATALALFAALLNAVFAVCLGCEVYLLLRRVTPRSERV
ncbi:DUF4395 domain-containing protein [Saccharomonospora iraqiensis]|uniref:DUF4395 domain-containing protein n=1 Tax=Saccharomonospora iraqiensis TaxID=52698 RepID=UPI00047978A6|nr:DUF4395 domain-containing protein [Saccharomonospora iraqiensis]